MLKINILRSPIKDISFVVVDVETTGFSPHKCKIVEIGAVKIQNGEVINTYESLVFADKIPSYVTKIHGIDASMVSDAPQLHYVKKEFCRFIDGCILVGHNIKRFDIKFLCKHLKINEKVPCVDTIALSKVIFPEERYHNMESVAKRLCIKHGKRHRALKDATINASVFLKLLKLGKRKFTILEDIVNS